MNMSGSADKALPNGSMNLKTRQTQSSGNSSVYFESLVGFLVLAGAVVTGVAGLFKVLLSLISASRKHVEPETLASVEPDPAPGFKPKVSSVSRDFSTYEPSVPRVAQFPEVGYLTLWGYRDRKLVHRQLVLSNPDLAKAVGATRLTLPDVPWNEADNLDAVFNRSIQECEIFLSARRKPVAAPVAEPIAVSANAPTVTSAQVDHEDPFEAFEAPKQAVAQPPAQPRPPAPGKPPYIGHSKVVQERTVGRLEYAGTVMRTFSDGSTGQTYGVDLQTDERPVRLHGVDLERALDSAGAKVGDLVEIEFTGGSTVPLPGGGKGNKKHFIARVLK